jgi:hypothetical protein
VRRLLISIALVTVLVAARTPAAFAGDPTSGGSVNSGGATATAGNGGNGPPVSSAGGGNGGVGGGSDCSYVPSYSGEYGPPSVFDPNADNGQPGQWYDVVCNTVYTNRVFVPAGSVPAGPVVNPVQLAQEALASAPFKPLQVVMSPPASREAVYFPVFLSLSSGFSTVTASASAGGVTSTVSIVPRSVTWSMGDGNSVTCTGPGVPFVPSLPFNSQLTPSGLPPCGYKYGASSANSPGQAFQMTVIVHYTASWTVVGAAGGGVLPPVDRSVTLPVTVGEIQVLS